MGLRDLGRGITRSVSQAVRSALNKDRWEQSRRAVGGTERELGRQLGGAVRAFPWLLVGELQRHEPLLGRSRAEVALKGTSPDGYHLRVVVADVSTVLVPNLRFEVVKCRVKLGGKASRGSQAVAAQADHAFSLSSSQRVIDAVPETFRDALEDGYIKGLVHDALDAARSFAPRSPD
jgi:hypothetical protein